MTDLRDLNVAPSPDFAARLESELLRELGRGTSGNQVDDFGAPPPIVDVRSIETVKFTTAIFRRKPFIMLTSAAAVIALIAAISSTGEHSARPANLDSPTTSVVASTTSAVEYLPMPRAGDEIGAGSYSVTSFAVPFTFTATAAWRHDKNRLNVFSLLRLTGPKLAVTSGVFVGQTPAEVIANLCPSVIDHSNIIDTTLLDQPALQIMARATGDCPLPNTLGDDINISLGEVVQITAADVNGEIVVAIAGALWPLWPSVEAEIAALIASMHPST